ncbi:MAG: sulfur carrier protein ThiS [Thiovulaceae bacterium]|jgi:sulfur carrier protein|nr:sulfur carrier protein ThiS [Sulfurimonadaceae bacterium]
MKVIINGTQKETKEQTTLLELLQELSLEEKVMAAAVNMQIVKQNEWDTFRLQEGDKLELLDFVGGG